MADTPNHSRRTGPALEKWYQFLRWLGPVVEGFARSHKFTLGERIFSGALDVLDRLIEATYSRQLALACSLRHNLRSAVLYRRPPWFCH